MVITCRIWNVGYLREKNYEEHNCVLEAEFAFLEIACLRWRQFHFELFRFLVSAADRCIRVEDVGNAEITTPMRRDWMKMRWPAGPESMFEMLGQLHLSLSLARQPIGNQSCLVRTRLSVMT